MRVVLHCLGLRAGGGLVDARRIVRTIPTAAPHDQFLAIVPAGLNYTAGGADNCEVIERQATNDLYRMGFDNWELPRLCRLFGGDVLFNVGNWGPARAIGIPQLTMVRQPVFAYTLSELAASEVETTWRDRLARKYFRVALRQANGLVFQTKVMRDRITSLHGAREVPTWVVTKAIEEKVEQVKPLRSSGGSVICVSRHYPHKNIERLCQAAKVANEIGGKIVLHLTIESTDNPSAAELVERIARGDFGDAVVNHGRVSQGRLKELYANMDAVVNASLLESLSATYIEAFATGRPLAASDRDFARDTCGGAARYFNPLDVRDIAAALRDITENEQLRKDLVRRGLDRYAGLRSSESEVSEKLYRAITRTAGV